MKYNEMKQAVNLLAEEWNLGKKESEAEGNICAWIYLIDLLEESEKIVTYKDGKKLVGFCGYSNKSSHRRLIKRKIYKTIDNILRKSKKIKDKEGFNQYENNYDYVPKELENYFDGEVSILIVDKNYRGQKIGEKLLLEVFKMAKKDNMKKLQILTDESCNYHFYEKCGCQKIYETMIENTEYGKLEKITAEKAFIYEKIL